MGTVLPFPGPASTAQVGFERFELSRIVDLYGRMVAAGNDHSRARGLIFEDFPCRADIEADNCSSTAHRFDHASDQTFVP